MSSLPGSRYLADGERLVLAVRRHPVVLAGPVAVALLALVGASAIGFLTGPDEGSTVVDTVVGLVALAIFVRLAWKLWLWSAERVVVTDRRFMVVSGVLTRRVATMPLGSVTDMSYVRSIAGRLFGYGELVVESAGQEQALSHLHHIPHPDDFYRTVTALSTSMMPEPEPKALNTWTGWPIPPEEDDTGPLPRVIV